MGSSATPKVFSEDKDALADSKRDDDQIEGRLITDWEIKQAPADKQKLMFNTKVNFIECLQYAKEMAGLAGLALLIKAASEAKEQGVYICEDYTANRPSPFKGIQRRVRNAILKKTNQVALDLKIGRALKQHKTEVLENLLKEQAFKITTGELEKDLQQQEIQNVMTEHLDSIATMFKKVDRRLKEM